MKHHIVMAWHHPADAHTLQAYSGLQNTTHARSITDAKETGRNEGLSHST